MTLRAARADDLPFVEALWRAPGHEDLLDPPADGVLDGALANGALLIWEHAARPAGFAALVAWHEDVLGLSAIAVTRPGQGRPFLAALLAEVFDRRGAHRLALDVTADNARALRLFEAAGFTREGRWRECWRRPSGTWVDCVLLGLLAREWRALPAG